MREMNKMSNIENCQTKAIQAFNFFKQLDDPTIGAVTLEFKTYSDVAELRIGCRNLLRLKKLLQRAGLNVPKLEKGSYSVSSGQYADGDDSENGIHIHSYPSGTGNSTFEGCKIVEEKVPIEVPEHTVPFQPAREAIPEHVEPAHIEYQTRKVIKCGGEHEQAS
jgi:hypothetical protein